MNNFRDNASATDLFRWRPAANATAAEPDISQTVLHVQRSHYDL